MILTLFSESIVTEFLSNHVKSQILKRLSADLISNGPRTCQCEQNKCLEKKVYESHKQSTCIIVKQGGRVVRFERPWAYPGCQAGFADIHVPHQNTLQTQFFPKGIFLFHVDIFRPARVFLHTLYILRLTWARTHARTKSWRGYTEPEGDGSGTRPMTGCSDRLDWQFPRKKKSVFYLFPVSSYILDIHTYNVTEMKTIEY